MFNNIIYFIIVLLLFNVSYTDSDQVKPFLYCLVMFILCWGVLVFYCRAGFARLVKLLESTSGAAGPGAYGKLTLRLSIISVFIFSLDVFVFNLKYWIEKIPFIGSSYVLQGLAAIACFLFYLSTIWYYACPAYRLIHNNHIDRSTFISGNIKLNIPVIFPWLLLALSFDLISVSPWKTLNDFAETPSGQFVFLSIIFFAALIYTPVLIRHFWGCKPVGQSFKAEAIKEFLNDIGLKYSMLITWPVFGGKMITAGIMGIIPKYRYILVTDSLMDILDVSELKSVMAHEAGHAKYNHQLLYALFFMGYIILSLGLFDPSFYFLVTGYFISRITDIKISGNIYYALLTIPMLLSLIIYFRFIMGFFMRHFERQADTYSALLTGDSSPIISSLEKIAFLSGKIRDLPSWHHFSIRERVDFLNKIQEDPSAVTGHKRMLITSFIIYLGVLLFFIYLLYLTPLKKNISNNLISTVISEQMNKNPDNLDLLESVAMAYHEMEKYHEARDVYEKILTVERRPGVLNNLAWLLITTDDENLFDPRRGLKLAREAVDMERIPIFIDTLAEAYWVNGNTEKAVRLIKEAIMLDKTGSSHFRKQLEKFSNTKRSRL